MNNERNVLIEKQETLLMAVAPRWIFARIFFDEDKGRKRGSHEIYDAARYTLEITSVQRTMDPHF